MAQLKPDEWPADSEPTTAESECPASTLADHDDAAAQAEAAMRDRLEQSPPVDGSSANEPTPNNK
jgi:hypothetical protein